MCVCADNVTCYTREEGVLAMELEGHKLYICCLVLFISLPDYFSCLCQDQKVQSPGVKHVHVAEVGVHTCEVLSVDTVLCHSANVTR